jgi:hypothetical protein
VRCKHKKCPEVVEVDLEVEEPVVVDLVGAFEVGAFEAVPVHLEEVIVGAEDLLEELVLQE